MTIKKYIINKISANRNLGHPVKSIAVLIFPQFKSFFKHVFIIKYYYFIKLVNCSVFWLESFRHMISKIAAAEAKLTADKMVPLIYRGIFGMCPYPWSVLAGPPPPSIYTGPILVLSANYSWPSHSNSISQFKYFKYFTRH
jgi:hypothetical protein